MATRKTTVTELALPAATTALCPNGSAASLYSAGLVPDTDDAVVASFDGVWTLDLATGKERRRFRPAGGLVCWSARVTGDGALRSPRFAPVRTASLPEARWTVTRKGRRGQKVSLKVRLLPRKGRGKAAGLRATGKSD